MLLDIIDAVQPRGVEMIYVLEYMSTLRDEIYGRVGWKSLMVLGVRKKPSSI